MKDKKIKTENKDVPVWERTGSTYDNDYSTSREPKETPHHVEEGDEDYDDEEMEKKETEER